MTPAHRTTDPSEDGEERRIATVREALAEEFGLDADELRERIPSGAAKTFDNRVGWATTYLYRVGLLQRPRRSVYRITDRGREVLRANTERIDLTVLSQYPEFAAFRKGSGRTPPVRPPVPGGNGGVTIVETTPEEAIEAAIGEVSTALAEELRDRIAANSPEFFENLVLDVLEKMGYGGGHVLARERLGRSGDEGIDGVIREDRLGLDVIYVQAKRWQATVGRPAIQAFVGALQGARAGKGVIFTASEFSREAREYAEHVSPRVTLVDGRRLAELMIEYNVGVDVKRTYDLKDVDENYFDAETA